jgi:hypothetical protein
VPEGSSVWCLVYLYREFKSFFFFFFFHSFSLLYYFCVGVVPSSLWSTAFHFRVARDYTQHRFVLHILRRAIPILHSSTRHTTMTTTTGNTSSSTSTSHSQSHSRTTTGSDRYRSTPITIARPGDEGRLNKQEIGDSSDDDDIGNDPNTTDNMLNQGISGLSLGYVGSVPTRPSGIRRRKPDHNNNNTQLQSSSLPAAPLLVSKGSDGRDRYVYICFCFCCSTGPRICGVRCKREHLPILTHTFLLPFLAFSAINLLQCVSRRIQIRRFN